MSTGEALHEPLTTREGWQRFVCANADPPQPPPDQVGGDAADAFDEARLTYHATFVTVATPAIRDVTNAGRRLVLLNRGQVSARRGLVVTGAATLGKTTAVTQLGKTHELAVRRRSPSAGERLPVVYITVPPAATPRMIAVEFARFLGLDPPRGRNITDIIDAVCGILIDTRCDLVLIDEIHNIDLGSRPGAEVSDTLKYFSERIPATFVYAGIHVERAGLFAGTRGGQIAGRFSLLPMRPFAHGTPAQRDQWKALVATLEHALRLHRHKPGTLLTLAAYLHDRTRGSIGSLSHLIRSAALDAILTGTERITRTTLDAVLLDQAAEDARASLPARPRRGAA